MQIRRVFIEIGFEETLLDASDLIVGNYGFDNDQALFFISGADFAYRSIAEQIMNLQVIGAGVGRTGTNSLRIALNTLGLGPCYHMVELISNAPVNVPLWLAALDGRPDWPAIFEGYNSAVDWPVAAFYRELAAAYPQAKFVLTLREPSNWAESFSETIYKLQAGGEHAPPDMKPWFDMANGVVAKSGFPFGMNATQLARAFEANTEAVKAALPAERLLTFNVKDGWGPLCAFLGVPEPDEAFPNTNSRGEFWERVNAKMAEGGF